MGFFRFAFGRRREYTDDVHDRAVDSEQSDEVENVNVEEQNDPGVQQQAPAVQKVMERCFPKNFAQTNDSAENEAKPLAATSSSGWWKRKPSEENRWKREFARKGILRMHGKRAKERRKRVTVLDVGEDYYAEEERGGKGLAAKAQLFWSYVVFTALAATCFMIPFRLIAFCRPTGAGLAIEAVLTVEAVHLAWTRDSLYRRRCAEAVLGWIPMIIGLTRAPCGAFLGTIILQLPRVWRFLQAMWAKRHDLNARMSSVAASHVAIIIFGCGHVLGCVSFGLARLNGFESKAAEQSWTVQFQERGYEGPVEGGGPMARYALALYKGMSLLSSLAYTEAAPENAGEFILTIIAAIVALSVVATVLGQLFVYVLRRDEEHEAHERRMQSLEDFGKERNLPRGFVERAKNSLAYQRKKASGAEKTEYLLSLLPLTLRRRASRQVTDHVVRDNARLFRGCADDPFLNEIASKVKEQHYQPGEVIRRHGDLPMELMFVQNGTLEELDEEGEIVRRVSALSDMPRCSAMEVVVGMTQQFTVRVAPGGEASVVALPLRELRHAAEESPKDFYQMLYSVLSSFGVSVDGSLAEWGGDDDRWHEIQRVNLMDAVEEGHSQRLNNALDAAERGDTGEVSRYVSMGLPVNASNPDGKTLLHNAAAQGNTALCSLLVSLGAELSPLDAWDKTPLDDALMNNFDGTARKLYSLGATLPQVAGMGTRLCRMAATSDTARLRKYLGHGAPADIAGPDGRVALAEATRCNSVACTLLLLDSGASPSSLDPGGVLPLQDAALNNYTILALIISSRGGKLASTAHEGDLLLVKYAAYGDGKVVEELLNIGANPHAIDYDGRTALHVAASAGQLHNVAGVSNNLNHEPFGILKMEDQLRTFVSPNAALLRKGAKASPRDFAGGTPLGDAALFGFAEIARFLEANGAQAKGDPRVKDSGLVEAVLEKGSSLADVRQQAAFLQSFSESSIALPRASTMEEGALYCHRRCMGIVEELERVQESLGALKSALNEICLGEDATNGGAKGVSKSLSALLSSTAPAKRQSLMLGAARSERSGDAETRLKKLNKAFMKLGLSEQEALCDMQKTAGPAGAAHWLGMDPEDALEDLDKMYDHPWELLGSAEIREAAGDKGMWAVVSACDAIKMAFEAFDQDGDQIVSGAELAFFSRPLRELGAHDLVDKCAEQGGNLTLERFAYAFASWAAGHTEENISRVSSPATELNDAFEAAEENEKGSEVADQDKAADEDKKSGESRKDKWQSRSRQHEAAKGKVSWWQRRQLSKAFKNLDKQGKGAIGREDVIGLIRACGSGRDPTTREIEEVERMLLPVGRNCEEEDFIVGLSRLAKQSRQPTLRELLVPWRIQAASAGEMVLPLGSRGVARPGAIWHTCWRFFIDAVLAFVLVAEVPFRLAFGPFAKYGMSYQGPILGLDGILLVDMAIKARTAFRNERSVVEAAPARTMRHYLGNEFPLDILSRFPIDSLALLSMVAAGGRGSIVYPLIAGLRLPRLALWVRMPTANTWLKVGLYALGTVHFLACIWWGTGRISVSADGHSWVENSQAFGHFGFASDGTIPERYLLSFQWVVTSVTKQGAIDNRVPGNVGEVLVALLIFLTNMTGFQLILGQITFAVSENGRKLVRWRKALHDIKEFIKTRQLPTGSVESLGNQCEGNLMGKLGSISSSGSMQGDQANAAMERLPGNVAGELRGIAAKATLAPCKLLDGIPTSSGLVGNLASALDEEVVEAGAHLFSEGTVPQRLCFVRAGRLAIVRHREQDDVTVGTVYEGQSVGESCLFGIALKVTVQAPNSEPCHILYLSKKDWDLFTQFYPEGTAPIFKNAIANLQGGATGSSEGSRTSGSRRSSGSSGVSGGSSSKGSSTGGGSNASTTSGRGKRKSALEQALEERHSALVARLLKSAKVGNIKKLETALATGEIDVSAKNRDGRTALHIAAHNGHKEFASRLLRDFSADPSIEDGKGRTPALEAGLKGHRQLVQELSEYGANPGSGAIMELHEVAERGDIEALSCVLDAGADISGLTGAGRTAAHILACNGGKGSTGQCIAEIASRGAKITAEDYRGVTPLWMAYNTGNVEAERALLQVGAKLKSDPVLMNTLAANNDVSTLRRLRELGMSMDSTDATWRSPIIVACGRGMLEVASWLARLSEVDLHRPDAFGRTALDEARRCGSKAVEALMVEADVANGNDEHVQKRLAEAKEEAARERSEVERQMAKNSAKSSVELMAAENAAQAASEIEEIGATVGPAFEGFCSLLTESFAVVAGERDAGAEDEEEEREMDMMEKLEELEEAGDRLEKAVQKVMGLKLGRVGLFRTTTPGLEALPEEAKEGARRLRKAAKSIRKKGASTRWHLPCFEAALAAGLSATTLENGLLSNEWADLANT